MTNADVVVAFNDAINARNLDALADLMHEDHEFVDSEGASVRGRAACVAAWRGFFEAFPDYRNVFDKLLDEGGGAVTAVGRSECSERTLAGPAVWQADVKDDLVFRWRVSDIDDSPAGHRDR